MSSFWWGQSALDELVEKATSELLPAGQVDLALQLEISDQIRSKKVAPKDAVKALKQRLTHKNPNVILATLSLIDTCVKNSGSGFVREVASREFMEELTHLLKVPTGCNLDVKEKVLSLIQVWGIAAKGNPSLSYISGTYSLLRAEGYVFPPVTEKIDSILLETAVAPEWTDSDCCERCRTSFTLTNRKHHCRQCGLTFCQQCSSKSLPLPHLGINDTVRVCDGCFIKVKLSKVADKEIVPNLLATNHQHTSSTSSSLTPAYTPSIKQKTSETTTQQKQQEQQQQQQQTDEQFDADLKKAIELSMKESEQRSGFTKPKPVAVEQVKQEEEDDPDLAAAIAASLQDMKLTSSAATPASYSSVQYKNSNELSSVDMENIQLFSTLMNRVRSVGGDVSSDAQVNNLYTQIGALQPKLVHTLDETNKKHETFVKLHEKLNLAVKSYDRLLEQRLANSALKTTNTGYPSYGVGVGGGYQYNNQYNNNNVYGSYNQSNTNNSNYSANYPSTNTVTSPVNYPAVSNIATPAVTNTSIPRYPPLQQQQQQQQQQYPSQPQQPEQQQQQQQQPNYNTGASQTSYGQNYTTQQQGGQMAMPQYSQNPQSTPIQTQQQLYPSQPQPQQQQQQQPPYTPLQNTPQQQQQVGATPSSYATQSTPLQSQQPLYPPQAQQQQQAYVAQSTPKVGNVTSLYPQQQQQQNTPIQQSSYIQPQPQPQQNYQPQQQQQQPNYGVQPNYNNSNNSMYPQQETAPSYYNNYNQSYQQPQQQHQQQQQIVEEAPLIEL